MTHNTKMTFHGSVRVAGKASRVSNLQLEMATTDPPNLETSRVWLNTTDKAVKVVVGIKADGAPEVLSLLSNLNLSSVIRYIYSGVVNQMTGSSIISIDSVVPSAVAGTLVWTQLITPKSSKSKFLIDFTAMVDCGVILLGSRLAVATLWRDSTLIAFDVVSLGNGNSPQKVSFHVTDQFPTGLASARYTVRFGLNTNGTWYLGRPALANLGGANRTSWTITEYETS